ncbi:class I SAM-dependent methyltransferase [Mucilaginibacter sp. UYCu711]|uniref:class I SAM-dependent methyltransferase n=1 Tax=Mucilaginibacter sp. UYCu711 TaxID=3156339 RepID=UPI003D18FD4F
MRQILKRILFLRNIVSFFRRLKFATSYYNDKYILIFNWLFSSNENTNFTFNLTKTNLEYLANFISVITKKSYDECFNVLMEPQADAELIDYVLKKIENLPYEEKRVADKKVEFGKRLGWYAFVRILKPEVIVETGVDKGLGSVLLCSALKKNSEEGFPGRFYGTDLRPEAGYLLDGIYKNFGEIIYGDSIESLKKMDFNIDIFINDSDHSADYEAREYETIKEKISEKSIILGDNSHVTSKLSDFSIKQKRNFLFFDEKPEEHWYPGGGIGVSF